MHTLIRIQLCDSNQSQVALDQDLKRQRVSRCSTQEMQQGGTHTPEEASGWASEARHPQSLPRAGPRWGKS